MEHHKIPVSHTIEHQGRLISVRGPLSPETLQTLSMHRDLDAFRKPQEQLEALIEISGLPEGRIVAAVVSDVIVGYVTFHYPDELELWSQGGMEDLIELGAIEVADEYRGAGLRSCWFQALLKRDNWRTASYSQPNIIGTGTSRGAVLMYGSTAR